MDFVGAMGFSGGVGNWGLGLWGLGLGPSKDHGYAEVVEGRMKTIAGTHGLPEHSIPTV